MAVMIRAREGVRRDLVAGGVVLVLAAVLTGASASAQNTGMNITDAAQPVIPMPPAYDWEEVKKGAKFKGATPASLATDAAGNIVMVGAKWAQQANGSVVPSALAWHSTDGLAWASVPVPDRAGSAIQSVIHGQDEFIAADSDGLLTSPTGEEWTLVPGAGILGEDGHAVALARTPTGYVAVGVIAGKGSSGKPTRTPAAWTSTDAVTWQRNTISDADGSASSVTVAGDGSMIASGLAKPSGAKKYAWTLWRSTDGGATWATIDAPTADGYPVLAFGAGRYTLGYLVSDEFFGSSGWWSSADGTTWESLPEDLLRTQLLAGIGDATVAITGTSVSDNAHVRASTDAVAREDAGGGTLLPPGEIPVVLIGLPDGRLLIAGSTRKNAFLWVGTSQTR